MGWQPLPHSEPFLHLPLLVLVLLVLGLLVLDFTVFANFIVHAVRAVVAVGVA